jgi:hypothetical protein
MTDLLFPPSARVTSQRIDAISNTVAARSIFTGAVRTLSRTGDRMRWGISTANASNEETYAVRAALQSLRLNASGQANRIWFADPGYRQRGSFPSTELLTNSNFASGTTGWTGGASEITWAVSDRVLRATRTAVTATMNVVRPTSAVTVTRYAPHVARYFVAGGRYAATLQGRIRNAADNETLGSSAASSSFGMIQSVATPYDTTCIPGIIDTTFAGLMAGDYIDVSFASLSRCALIDNGTNLLLHSDTLDAAAWTATRASVSAVNGMAPDGGADAVAIIEDSTAANTHQVSRATTVSSAVADYSFSVALKIRTTRTWAHIVLSHGTGASTAWVNLSTGALGTVSGGSDWSNARAVVTSLGNGWYVLTLTARKTNSSTSITTTIRPTTGDGVQSYDGDGSGSIYVWRATLAQSSVPTRLVQTTSAATSGSSQTGADFYTKGWPASTNGLLLEGDRVQIGNQLNIVVAPVNSDAAGRAYLQLAYPLRSAPADNAPIIINSPMARCVLGSNEGGWSDAPGRLSDFDFVLEEALDA